MYFTLVCAKCQSGSEGDGNRRILLRPSTGSDMLRLHLLYVHSKKFEMNENANLILTENRMYFTLLCAKIVGTNT